MRRIQEFDFNVDLMKCLLWQHDDADALKKLIEKKQAWYATNQKDFWVNWVRDVFDLDTANQFGLSVWARILGISLQVRVEAEPTRRAWGFGSNNLNFNNGSFGRVFSGEIGLTEEQQRLVLKLRYFQLVSRGAIPEINEFLANLFAGQGVVYAYDFNDMTMAYIFTFTPDSQLSFILEKYDLLPRPAGVQLLVNVRTRAHWGFGVNHLNFNNGSFGE